MHFSKTSNLLSMRYFKSSFYNINSCCKKLPIFERYNTYCALIYTKNVYKKNQPFENCTRLLGTNHHNIQAQSKTKESSNLVELDDADTFGYLGRKSLAFNELQKEDEGDKREDGYINELPLHKQKLRMQKYIDMIKLHVANKRLKEAIDVLEIRMLQEDRVKPSSFIYNVLIGSCARMGYTEKAFKLFNDMKRRGLSVSGGVYTSLFNACANSPNKADGIRRANKLRELMMEKSVSPNTTTYNCMIKAYGRCGDVKSAFEIVDELIQLKIYLRTHTYNFLLQACISDKNSGFRTALLTWRKMLCVKEKPNIYSFNLLLRCIKECGFGDNLNNNEVINDMLALVPKRNTNLMLDESSPKQLDTNKCSALQVYDDQNQLPNFIERFPDMKNTLGFGNVETVQDRFMMVGGAMGIMKEMLLYKVKPDIIFFTQLLELIPSTVEAEIDLLNHMKQFKVKTDISFYNMLMKKRCFRYDYNSAKEVLEMIKRENKLRKRVNRFVKNRKLIKIDIITYGILAMCCVNKESAVEFIQNLKDQHIRMNAQILGALFKQAIYHNDFEYIKFVIDTTLEENILVNDAFLKHFYKHYGHCSKVLASSDKPEDTSNHTKFVDNFSKFRKMLKEKKIEEPKHSWEQFTVNQPETAQRHRDHLDVKKKIYRTERRRVPRYIVKY